jgi:hypothetical protein
MYVQERGDILLLYVTLNEDGEYVLQSGAIAWGKGKAWIFPRFTRC